MGHLYLQGVRQKDHVLTGGLGWRFDAAMHKSSHPLSHLDEAEADPLFGQVGVVGNIWLSLHHRFILINSFLIPHCRKWETAVRFGNWVGLDSSETEVAVVQKDSPLHVNQLFCWIQLLAELLHLLVVAETLFVVLVQLQTLADVAARTQTDRWREE